MRIVIMATVLIAAIGIGYCFAEPVFGDIPGSYAIYHDTRFDDDAYVGIAFVGDDTLLARSYEVKTGNELLLLVPFVGTENGTFETGSNLRVLKGSFKSSPAAGRLLPMLLNWGNTWLKQKNSIEKDLALTTSTDDDYFYQYWIPVFQLEKIGDPRDRFTLITVGILKGNGDPRFLSFQGLPDVLKSDEFSIAPGLATMPVIDGLKVPLDSNWKSTDNRIFRIQQKTGQDAVFFVETMNIKEQGITSIQLLAKLLLIGNQDSPLIAQGSRIFVKDGVFNCFIRTLDQNNHKASIQESQIVDRGDGVVSIVSLASFETLYLSNKEYFDRIIY